MSSSIRKRNARKLSFRRYCNRKNEKQPSGCFFLLGLETKRLGDVRRQIFCTTCFLLIQHTRGHPRLAALACPFQRKGLVGRPSLVSSFRAKSRNLPCILFSCRMALLVCIFSMRSHTHHFSFCYEDPSASLGMTPWEKRQLSSVGAIPLPKEGGDDSHPHSSGRRCPRGAEVSLPHV